MWIEFYGRFYQVDGISFLILAIVNVVLTNVAVINLFFGFLDSGSFFLEATNREQRNRILLVALAALFWLLLYDFRPMAWI